MPSMIVGKDKENVGVIFRDRRQREGQKAQPEPKSSCEGIAHATRVRDPRRGARGRSETR